MTSEVRLGIGGFIIALTILPGCDSNGLPPAYARFLAEGEADVRIQVHPGPRPTAHQTRESVFRAGPNWSLFRSAEQYVLATMFHETVFSPDFRCAELYLRTGENDSARPYFFDYPLAELLMINLLGREQGLVLHACGVVLAGQGLLFCGPSGAGKSTLANIWLAHAGAGVLGDDRIIVRDIHGALTAYGTPWHGTAGLCSAEAAPINKIFFIEHATENRLHPLGRTAMAARLLTSSFPPFWDSAGMTRSLEFVDTLSAGVAGISLGFVPDDRIVEFVCNV